MTMMAMQGVTCSASEAVSMLDGITYRQLDYWTKGELLEIAGPADGSGSRRRFSIEDLLRVRAIAVLADHCGWPLITCADRARKASFAELTGEWLLKHGRITYIIDMRFQASETDLAWWVQRS
jgi:hypothetical protein